MIWNESLGCYWLDRLSVTLQFNVRQTVVVRVWQRFLDSGSVDERAGRGRPRKTTDHDDRYIVNMADVGGLNPLER